MSPSFGEVAGATGQYADLERHPDNVEVPGICILRVESGLFFANAESVRTAIREHAARPGTRAVILDAEAIAFVDVTAVRMIEELASDLASAGVQLVMAQDLGQVGDILATEHADTHVQVYRTVDEAIAAVGASGP